MENQRRRMKKRIKALRMMHAVCKNGTTDTHICEHECTHTTLQWRSNFAQSEESRASEMKSLNGKNAIVHRRASTGIFALQTKIGQARVVQRASSSHSGNGVNQGTLCVAFHAHVPRDKRRVPLYIPLRCYSCGKVGATHSCDDDTVWGATVCRIR
ncbi:hypothetical protein TRVL_02301 [Trypanosoma vivax]|nr:hypothetical protein TRVL_02301 [Trypanosoma vivax]